MTSVTINAVTTELYSSAEVVSLFASLGGVGHIDGFKARHRLRTYRLFSANESGVGKVMYAPTGFTWAPNLLACSATTMATRTNYFDKAQIDALVIALS